MEACEQAWEGVRGPDLYLAQACEVDAPGAWDQLHATYASRLTAIANRQGLRGADAEGLATEVLAELSLPPSSGQTRTRMGSFGGACTLAGWLAVILTRRIAAQARRKRPTSLDATSADGDEARPEPEERTPSDPLGGCAGRRGPRPVADRLRQGVVHADAQGAAGARREIPRWTQAEGECGPAGRRRTARESTRGPGADQGRRMRFARP